MGLPLGQIGEADELLTDVPLALLIGMVLDQQIPLERAFAAPLELTRRLGRGLDSADLAATDPDKLAAVFSVQPALHRFPYPDGERHARRSGRTTATGPSPTSPAPSPGSRSATTKRR
nr:hypothetical protein [Frankia sp. AgB32]